MGRIEGDVIGIFENPNGLPIVVISYRLRLLDTGCFVRRRLIGRVVAGQITEVEGIEIDSSLGSQQIIDLLSTPQTTEESNSILAFVNSSTDFASLNGWFTWSKEEAVSHVVNAVFSGKTLAEVDADIDALPANVAGMRQGLHNAAAQIIAIRNLLTFIVRVVVFLRDYAIRLRR